MKKIVKIIKNVMSKNNLDKAILNFVGCLIYWALLLVVCIGTLGQLGIHAALFTAIGAAAGLIVGLTLQVSPPPSLSFSQSRNYRDIIENRNRPN